VIDFLTEEDVETIHDLLLATYGGAAGVLSRDLLASAVRAPEAGMGSERFHSDLPEIAAAYLFYIIRDHPFMDGNKRTASACAYGFLLLNGHSIPSSLEVRAEFEDLALRIARGEANKDAAVEHALPHTSVARLGRRSSPIPLPRRVICTSTEEGHTAEGNPWPLDGMPG